MMDTDGSARRSPLTRLLTWFHGSPGGSPADPAGPQLPWRRVLPVALLGVLAALLIVGYRAGLPQELDPVAPFVIGTQWETAQVLTAQGVSISAGSSTYGYDGQWFLGQAYDPLLRTEVASTFDAPRYRSLRVLVPATGWLLAAGQPAAIPYALLVVEILAVGLGCAACARILSGYGRSRWWGALFAAIPGVYVGVAYGTAEPLGVAFAALGLSLLLDRRYAGTGLAFAAAMLTKETYLAFAAVAVGYVAVDSYLRGRAWVRPVAWVAAPGAVLLAAWWWYVSLRLPPDTGPDPLRVFAVPLSGWWDALGTILGDPAHAPAGWGGSLIMIATSVLLLAALGLALRRRRSIISYNAFVWGVYALTLSGLLLGRFLSTQRALAPAVLAAGLLVIATTASARGGTGIPERTTTGASRSGPRRGPAPPGPGRTPRRASRTALAAQKAP